MEQLKYWLKIIEEEDGKLGVFLFYLVHFLLFTFIIIGIYFEVKK